LVLAILKTIILPNLDADKETKQKPAS